ncbi:hypothetical protein GRAN_1070 [Granulicella sibirica]|uniref:Uncharacterized protein n=1 Tax=Granulicella sibirica TaxID=2479048 RepID=A0A4Q0T572_9BACT|nr:hypothetical protein GRAN_1070 [Granulicella sibirica]
MHLEADNGLVLGENLWRECGCGGHQLRFYQWGTERKPVFSLRDGCPVEAEAACQYQPDVLPRINRV